MKAQIEARYVMAERHPRDLDVVREKLLKECKRPGFAAVARYLKPVGKGLEGPSIRFVETAIRLMGNIATEQITIYDDREKRIVRVAVSDCETNTVYFSDVPVEKTVERRSARDGDDVLRTRTNSKGNLLYIIAATEDDLLNKQNALVSKAIRSNGLRLVPGDIVEECMVEVLATQANEDAIDPEHQKRKIFDAFNVLGVGVDQLKVYLQHEAAQLTPKEITDLRAVYSAIKDGETTWREIMDARDADKKEKAPKSPLAEVKEQLKGAKAAQQSLDAVWPREPGGAG